MGGVKNSLFSATLHITNTRLNKSEKTAKVDKTDSFRAIGCCSDNETYRSKQFFGFTEGVIPFTLSIISLWKMCYSKTCLKRPLKNRQNKGLKDKW